MAEEGADSRPEGDPAPEATVAPTKPTEERQPVLKVGERVYWSADEIIADLQNKDQVIGRQGKELGELRKVAKPVSESQVKPNGHDVSAQPDEDELLAITDPKLFREKIKRELKQEVKAEQTWEKIWERFYQENSDLDGDTERLLVDKVTHDLWNDVKDIPITEGLVKIATETRKRIASLARKANTGDKEVPLDNKPVATLGGRGSPLPKPQAPKEDDVEDRGLTDILWREREKKLSPRRR